MARKKSAKKGKSQYERIVKSNGKAFADEWLANKQGRSNGVNSNRRAKGRGSAMACCIISPQLRAYNEALLAPWDDTKIAPVPHFPMLPAIRLCVWVKGTLTTTAGTGYGFVMMQPFGAHANDVDSVWYTNGGVLAANHFVKVDGTSITAAKTNSPFTSLEEYEFRPIAAGIRARLNTTRLNEGGQAFSTFLPNDDSILNYEQSDQLELPGVTPRYMGTSWQTVTWRPTRPGDYNYHPASATGKTSLGISFKTAATSQNVYFEACAMYEFFGRKVRGGAVGKEDAAGVDALSQANEKHGVGMHTFDPLENMERVAEIMQSGSHVASAAGGLAAAATGAYISYQRSRARLEL